MSETKTLIPLELAAEVGGMKLKSFERWLQRRHVPTVRDPEDRRRKLVSLSDLPPEIAKAYHDRQAKNALEQLATVSSLAGAGSRQPSLTFDFSSATETDLLAAAPPAIPKSYQADFALWSEILGLCLNGAWKRYLGYNWGGIVVNSFSEFIHACAKVKGVGLSTIYRNIGRANRINADPAIPADQKMTQLWKQMVPRRRPGRSGHCFFSQPEHAWMAQTLLNFYLTQAKRSVRQAWQLLLAEIDARERAWGPGHPYDRPTLSQCRTLLEGIDLPTLTLARDGEKAFNDRCGKYISRSPDGLHSNDLWVTDQKQIDVRLRDGGERLGRIWEVNFMDVASDKVLGYAFGPVLNSDMVMRAAAMAIERYGVPRTVHMDLGKEFICKAFHGPMHKFSGETLYREALGLCQALEMHPVKAIGRNPQSKTIERYNANQTAFDRECPGYCGSNPEARPEKLAEQERQHEGWKKTGQGYSPLWTIGQYIRGKINWIENEWNAKARGRGKMRRGMTPNEAYNVKRPPQGFRTITPDELDRYTADHHFVKVARGGQVNLTFYGQTIEYEAPELFNLQGVEVEAIVSRRTFRKIAVIYPINGGVESCTANLKPQLEWLPENRDELRAAMRCKAAVHRAVREGLKAKRLEIEAENPVELLEMQKALPAAEQVGGQKLFGLPNPLPPEHREISSMEWMEQKLARKRPRFANERAAAVVEAMKEE